MYEIWSKTHPLCPRWSSETRNASRDIEEQEHTIPPWEQGEESHPLSVSKGFLAFLPPQKAKFLPPSLTAHPRHTQYDLGGKLSKKVMCGSMYFIKLMCI